MRVATAASLVIAAVLWADTTALAQTLYERHVHDQPVDVETVREQPEQVGRPDGAPPTIAQTSLYYVAPETPREFVEHDLVTIIISERTESTHEQTLETEKSTELAGGVDALPQLMNLLEFRLDQGDTDVEVSAIIESLFSGEGEFERTDEVTGRVTAQVVEIKPNGVLLLEAKSTIVNNEETHGITISGYVRSEDVTAFNTVQSNQMYDLMVNLQNSGQIDEAATKGLLTRVLDTIFNF